MEIICPRKISGTYKWQNTYLTIKVILQSVQKYKKHADLNIEKTHRFQFLLSSWFNSNEIQKI